MIRMISRHTIEESEMKSLISLIIYAINTATKKGAKEVCIYVIDNDLAKKFEKPAN
jgi:hypothetical protein